MTQLPFRENRTKHCCRPCVHPSAVNAPDYTPVPAVDKIVKSTCGQKRISAALRRHANCLERRRWRCFFLSLNAFTSTLNICKVTGKLSYGNTILTGELCAMKLALEFLLHHSHTPKPVILNDWRVELE